jgi:ABC-2 type transport system permease protein
VTGGTTGEVTGGVTGVVTGGTAVEPAIHDIGYQRYAGPRLGRAAIWRALAVDGLRGSFGLGRSAGAKVWPWLLLALATLPTVVIVVIASVAGDLTGGLPVTPAQYLGQILTLVGIFVAVLAPRAVSRDLRYRTVPLYLSRPLSRTDYVTAKVAAMTAAVLVVTAVPVTVLALGALLAEQPWRDTSESWLAGTATALLAAVLLATTGLAIAAWTPRRGLGTAAVVGYLIVTSAVAGVATGLTFDRGADAVGYTQALSPLTVVPGLAAWLEGTPLGPTGETVGTPVGLVLLGTWAASVALALAVLAVRYRRVSAS